MPFDCLLSGVRLLDCRGAHSPVARDAGVPAIYVEYLGAHRERAELASGEMKSGRSDHPLVAGCLHVMRHLDMLEVPEAATEDQEVIEDWRPESGHIQACNPAPAKGFLYPKVTLGQQVAPGNLLAEIVSETGDRMHDVVSQQRG